MHLDEKTSTDSLLQARDRYVPRGVSTPSLVVTRAWGARIWDAEGREYLDFAGGIACQNLGHGPAGVVRAIHEQVDRYLHQCFMVGIYEPYIELARRLDELWPGDAATKTLLLNSGAEAIENAVKIARAATGRAGVVVFDRAFHGRTNLTMAMTSKLVYKQGFGPLATDVHRAPAPYPYRGVSTEDALHGLELLFKQDVDPADVACFVLEPVQGEGGFIPMPPEFVRALKEVCGRHGILYVDDEVQSGCGRTGTMWAIERFDVEPDLIVSAATRSAARQRLRSSTSSPRPASASAPSRSRGCCEPVSTRSRRAGLSSARCAGSGRCSRSSSRSRTARRRRRSRPRRARRG